MLAVGRAPHGRQRHQEGRLRRSGDRDHVDEGARAQHLAEPPCDRAEAHGSIGGVDAGVLGDDLRRGAAAGDLRAGQADRHARPDRGRHVLGQREIDVGVAVDALEHRDARALVEIGAGLEIGQADAGAKGCHKRLLGDAGLEARHAGGRGRQLLARPIEIQRRDGIARTQPVASVEDDAAPAGLPPARPRARRAPRSCRDAPAPAPLRRCPRRRNPSRPRCPASSLRISTWRNATTVPTARVEAAHSPRRTRTASTASRGSGNASAAAIAALISAYL